MKQPYKELHVWQLSSSTTCYSGLKSSQKKKKKTFATATHVITIDDADRQKTKEQTITSRLPMISGRRIPTIRGQTSCVGYSSSLKSSSDHHHQEVFLLLKDGVDGDPIVKSASLKGSSSKTTTTIHRLSANSSSLSGAAEQLQSSSNNNNNNISTTGDLLAIRSASSLGQQQQQQHDGNIKAWLIWKTTTTSTTTSSQKVRTLQLPLNFRPLCPLLSHDLVWVGSADDSKLRCYKVVVRGTAENDDKDSQLEAVIEPVPLREMDNIKAFEFSSPIMTLDALDDVVTETTTNNKKCWLSVGCQDGTIRVVNMDENGLPQSQHNWMVDGPIISMVFSSRIDGDDVVIQHYIGSMCGYVCKLIYKEGRWHGPSLVLDGLWDARLETDDAVLAVCPLKGGTLLALGTFSGKVYLIDETITTRNNNVSKNANISWQCQLSHTIHAIAPDVQDDFFVTTRRSVHWFGPNDNSRIDAFPSKPYDTNLAIARIKKLAAERGITLSTDKEG